MLYVPQTSIYQNFAKLLTHSSSLLIYDCTLLSLLLLFKQLNAHYGRGVCLDAHSPIPFFIHHCHEILSRYLVMG